MQEINLNDIANELLIINKNTIDKLFTLDNSADCIALYVFYYKTAKWQRTNIIKATDNYVAKCLKWGTKKIRETKKTLKENGLIDIIQKRENGKILGWYIQVSYIVSKKNTEDIKIIVDSKNAQNQQVAEATSGLQETNALKEYIKYLKKEIETLKSEKNKKENKYIYYGEYKNVFFTEEQYQKLLIDFPNDYEKRIQSLDDYMQSKGKKYKDCLATIRNWARKEEYKFPNKENKKQEELKEIDISGLTSEEYDLLVKKKITIQDLIKKGRINV